MVLEQFRVGHAGGSSHGSTRIFRLAYQEPEWVRLAQESLRLWRELEAEKGEQVLDLTGLVDLPVDASRVAWTLDACGARYGSTPRIQRPAPSVRSASAWLVRAMP